MNIFYSRCYSWIFSIITPVFSVIWYFRNNYNMLICCSRNIIYWKLLWCFIFVCKPWCSCFFLLLDEVAWRTAIIWNINFSNFINIFTVKVNIYYQGTVNGPSALADSGSSFNCSRYLYQSITNLNFITPGLWDLRMPHSDILNSERKVWQNHFSVQFEVFYSAVHIVSGEFFNNLLSTAFLQSVNHILELQGLHLQLLFQLIHKSLILRVQIVVRLLRIQTESCGKKQWSLNTLEESLGLLSDISFSFRSVQQVPVCDSSESRTDLKHKL